MQAKTGHKANANLRADAEVLPNTVETATALARKASHKAIHIPDKYPHVSAVRLYQNIHVSIKNNPQTFSYRTE